MQTPQGRDIRGHQHSPDRVRPPSIQHGPIARLQRFPIGVPGRIGQPRGVQRQLGAGNDEGAFFR